MICFFSLQCHSRAPRPPHKDAEGKRLILLVSFRKTQQLSFRPLTLFFYVLYPLSLQSLSLSLHIKREGGSPTSPPRPSEDAHSDRYQVRLKRYTKPVSDYQEFQVYRIWYMSDLEEEIDKFTLFQKMYSTSTNMNKYTVSYLCCLPCSYCR